ncbi:carbamoyl phosphate synthase small subunit [Ammoniphilus sp. YIM 78166]|uniref:carbamoyl phosphate synthase small subunit n=1 Tax=Ammoniphilus sp. YIM 78166 TaxID=1644106 RepID=UPI00106FA963|nr:carbamoyl phosphate synthase small subunit [Ammoniphilus sp. YIM 78166]
MKGYLVLSTGDVFEGTLFGNLEACQGELVFNTGMTGYQEVLTDPSYSGQIVTFTYPLIGNYGVNDIDDEAIRPACKGLVVGELCTTPSHYLSKNGLAEMAKKHGLGGITGIDTRTVTQIIRENGLVFGKITTDPADLPDTIPVTGQVEMVSTEEAVHYPGQGGPHVVLIDFGYKKSILDSLLARGCSVTVVPYHIKYKEMKAIDPNGILLSNGPGDPKEMVPYLPELKRIIEAHPTLGICLGHQVTALIYGCDTGRLPYGHRGSNHPVKNLETGKVYLTSQNHGYMVKEESVNKNLLDISYINVNDKSVEGLAHRHLPISTVQFHPEAHPGPSDTDFIFDEFVKQCQLIGEKTYA